VLGMCLGLDYMGHCMGACMRGRRSLSFLGWSGFPRLGRGVWGIGESTERGRRDGDLVTLLAASPGTHAVRVCFSSSKHTPALASASRKMPETTPYQRVLLFGPLFTTWTPASGLCQSVHSYSNLGVRVVHCLLSSGNCGALSATVSASSFWGSPGVP
jgi:hypothetical protein